MHVKFHGSTPSLRWFLGKKTPKTAILGTFFWDIRTRTWYWVKQAWISIPQGNAHISRPNMIGATGLAFLTPLSFELEILTVWGIRISSSKFRGVKRASPVAPIKLGLEMCALPRGIQIQTWLTQLQVHVRMPPKKPSKMAENGHFWPLNLS